MLQSIHFLSSQQHWIVPFQMNKLIILNTIQHYVWNQLLCKDYLKWILLFVWVRNDSWFLFKCYCHFLFIMFFVWFLFCVWCYVVTIGHSHLRYKFEPIYYWVKMMVILQFGQLALLPLLSFHFLRICL